MLTPTARDTLTARQALTDHPRYRYRGCAPDIDEPTQAAGNLNLTVDAWAPYTGDGAEPQTERHARERAAIEVCVECPVMVACLTYANTPITTRDSNGAVISVRLTEPEGIWGGELALTRHHTLIARRTRAAAETTAAIPAKVLAACRTPQKQAVLNALAIELYDARVAHRARMDIRTTNWHRAALCSQLGLDKETATRDDLLAAALHHKLLPPTTRIVWDGLWPVAAAPTTDGIRQRRIAPGFPHLNPPPKTRTPRSNTARPAPEPHLRLLPPYTEHLTLPVPTMRLEAAS
ncbi:hypothetical protein [Streptomyces sp. NPDC005407]|uniref:hypothetical protein n=1 Tax=Streptomyces sp. NPDC005407 TaxID=3155340 RepID=UPI0033B7E0C9